MTVDGKTATIGDRIDPANAVVEVDGVRLPLDPQLRTWLIYKPAGVVSTMDDPQGRPVITDLVPKEPVTKPVGRLDLHSEGLMLLTNDGDLALRVTHPRYGIEKVYQVMTTTAATSRHTTALLDGVDLDDGFARAKKARIVSTHGDRSVVEVVMTEGRKREVRRLFEAVGLEVDRLVRVSIAGITDRTLTPGNYRPLSIDEIRSIYQKADASG
ncbi:MAG: pseudouridine synthase [Acidimicrobiia bacterium]|nr:pseudouridine synthase [Acidimicrobiia bacterium]